MDVSEKLANLMKGKSADELAEIARVSRATIYNWSSGKTPPKLQGLILLARRYGVPLEYFLDDTLDEVPGPYLSREEEYLLRVYRDSELDASLVAKEIMRLKAEIAIGRAGPDIEPEGDTYRNRPTTPDDPTRNQARRGKRSHTA